MIPAPDSLDDGADDSRDSPKPQNDDEFEAQNCGRRLGVEEGDVQTPGNDHHQGVKYLIVAQRHQMASSSLALPFYSFFNFRILVIFVLAGQRPR